MSVTPEDESPVEGGYCSESDLRTGDIRLPSYLGTKAQLINRASDEIDAAIGHIYQTPIDFGDPVPLASRPAMLTLKKINWLLASGRAMLDMAAVAEDANQHAYGLGMLKEGLGMLKQIVDGEMILTGADKIDTGDGADEKDFSGPKIFNEDPDSLVQSFYTQRRPFGDPRFPGPARPYGIPGVISG